MRMGEWGVFVSAGVWINELEADQTQSARAVEQTTASSAVRDNRARAIEWSISAHTRITALCMLCEGKRSRHLTQFVSLRTQMSLSVAATAATAVVPVPASNDSGLKLLTCWSTSAKRTRESGLKTPPAPPPPPLPPLSDAVMPAAAPPAVVAERAGASSTSMTQNTSWSFPKRFCVCSRCL